MSERGLERPIGEGDVQEVVVLHVDDDERFTDLTTKVLEREHTGFIVLTETDAKIALERLETTPVDCIVSDYEMPTMDGLEFLEAVRALYPDLPFIHFTGRGSEEIAAEAISAGVTDYLQKGSGTDQYTVLANRIENAVSQYRTTKQIEATREWYQTILRHSSDYVMVVDEDGIVDYVTPPIERVMGFTPEDVIGVNAFSFTHPDDLEHAATVMAEIVSQPDCERTVEFRARTRNGSWRWLEVRGRNLLDNPVIEGIMVNIRDITQRKKREQESVRRKEQLRDLTSFLSHDLRNQLNVINGRLSLLPEDLESEHIEAANRTVRRMNEMIGHFTELAERGQIPTSIESVDLAPLVMGCWDRLSTADAELILGTDRTIEGDPEQLRSLFENIIQNAIDHGGHDVTVHVGELENGGFFVEDDGPGISESDRDRIFEPRYSTAEDGDGFGLAFVKHIAEAHGWRVNLEERNGGGARFEFTNEV